MGISHSHYNQERGLNPDIGTGTGSVGVYDESSGGRGRQGQGRLGRSSSVGGSSPEYYSVSNGSCGVGGRWRE